MRERKKLGRTKKVQISFKTYLRIFAFWDKTEKVETLVLATHGIIKKTGKTPEKEIEKAESIRMRYFELKKYVK